MENTAKKISRNILFNLGTLALMLVIPLAYWYIASHTNYAYRNLDHAKEAMNTDFVFILVVFVVLWLFSLMMAKTKKGRLATCLVMIAILLGVFLYNLPKTDYWQINRQTGELETTEPDHRLPFWRSRAIVPMKSIETKVLGKTFVGQLEVHYPLDALEHMRGKGSAKLAEEIETILSRNIQSNLPPDEDTRQVPLVDFWNDEKIKRLRDQLWHEINTCLIEDANVSMVLQKTGYQFSQINLKL